MNLSLKPRWAGCFLCFTLCSCAVAATSAVRSSAAAPDTAACRIEPAKYEGWDVQQVSNRWVTLTIVPQVGGRVMQVAFMGHPYLFVNEKFKGQYFPPEEAQAKSGWVNYGGDKIWPMPEGTGDDQHWPGPISDNLDDGSYNFTVLSRGQVCSVRLESPPDARTGLQYIREVSLRADSTEIAFRAIMKNFTGHPIRWSVQSVTQYDTSDHQSPAQVNRDFWAFTPANPRSAYLDQFHVRAGLADDPSFSIRNGLFTLHWLNLQNEVWIDSPGDWLAVVDGAAGYSMLERFHVFDEREYPGKATVIFYKNGPALQMDDQGMPFVPVNNPEDRPHYMEAEINSPMVSLSPGESYTMETQWYPSRMTKQFSAVTTAGALLTPLSLATESGQTFLMGDLAPFWPGELQAVVYGRHGTTQTLALGSVDPAETKHLHASISIPPEARRISVHLIDLQGLDRGSIGELDLRSREGSS